MAIKSYRDRTIEAIDEWVEAERRSEYRRGRLDGLREGRDLNGHREYDRGYHDGVSEERKNCDADAHRAAVKSAEAGLWAVSHVKRDDASDQLRTQMQATAAAIVEERR